MNCDYWVKDGESLTYELKEEIRSINEKGIGRIRWFAEEKAWKLFKTNPDNWDYKYLKVMGLTLTPVIDA